MIKVDVWSDINCPYCYIGKRNLEKALEKFPRAESVEVEWKSFELDPYSQPEKGANQIDLLAEKYGKDRAWALSMNKKMTEMASDVGIEFHLDKTVPANSFKAHKLLHLAKFYGIQNEVKEALFQAKFCEGKDISDDETLIALGTKENLNPEEIREVLEGKRFDMDVRKDEETGARLGIRGVPFFVINQSEALSGAQPPEAFLEVLESMN